MKKYNAKTLFTGYKIGLKNPHLYIGVPKRYFNGGTKSVPVNYAGELRFVSLKESVAEKTFNDRFRPGATYTLSYILWEKVKEESIDEEK